MQTEEENIVEAAYQRNSKKSLLCFVRGLEISSVHGPMLFDLVMADFQRKFFGAVGESLEAVRDGRMPPCKRFWLERTKKTGKDADVACCLLWLMAFSERPILGQVCAANSKQAAIIEDRARAILHLNPWLNESVEIVQREIRSKELPELCKVQIEATGSAGAAQGPTPDVLVLNELVHVDRWDVMKAHMNNAAGVPRGVVIVATNAGVKGTPAEAWRKIAFDPHQKYWRTFLWQKRAPWLSEVDVQEAKRMDPIGADYARLWEGKWVSGIGDAVDEESISRSFRLGGPSESAEESCRYVAGLDLGVSHDHSGIVVLGINRECQQIETTWYRGFEPSVPNDAGKLEVDLVAVERACFDAYRKFRIEWFGYDPAAGGSFMAQRLRKQGVPMKEVSFASPATQTNMAVAFVTSMKDSKLACYDDGTGVLRRDFGKFNIEHRPPSRYRLVAVSDEFGHADVGTALVICLPRAVEILSRSYDWSGDIGDEGIESRGLSDGEIESMPAELREIYEGGDSSDQDHGRSEGRRTSISDVWG